MTRPVVLLYESMHKDAIELLRTKCEVRFATSLDEEQLIHDVQDVDGIIIRANGMVSRRLMEHAPRLKVVARHGAGIEAIDLAAAKDRGIVVVNTPDASTESVAEHCIGLMIALAKKILPADRALRKGKWDARYELTGNELLAKSLGLVGFGRIGQRVAEIAVKAFQMKAAYSDIVPYPNAEATLNARRLTLDELLSRVDFVSVHVPYLPTTHGLIGARELACMKRSAYLINTARGAVVDEAALLSALQEHRIAGAALDVFASEPIARTSPLLSVENVIVSPHMASHTEEALRRMAMVVEDVMRVLDGQAPTFPVC